MSDLNFRDVFRAATGFPEPYPYQCRLACGPDASLENNDSLRRGTPCRSQLINIPTGLGKTAGVVIAWLWNRVLHPDGSHRNSWPRRLVYCLPMRTLVEQTRESVKEWLQRLNLAWDENGEHRGKVGLHILMGGEDDGEWDLYPECEAILIGTQDMLLSRALNRGYGMSRYRWPMHFGLLNNDCVWVLDEVQLMGPGLATACQLEAFRSLVNDAIKPGGLGSYFGSRPVTWYASATSSRELLSTREWRNVQRPDGFEFGLTDAEKTEKTSPVNHRRLALKYLETHEDWHLGTEQPSDDRVSDIIARHQQMAEELQNYKAIPKVPRRSLIICNTVDRAVAVFDALRRKQAIGELQEVDLLLLHSRFRPPDRKARMDRLKLENLRIYPNGQIVVSTQVIEAGVDISSGILWTEVAPLSSLVQRLGRLNREGEFGSNGQVDYNWMPRAVIVGLELPEIREKQKEKKEQAEKEVHARYLPYDQRACDAAWSALAKLKEDASPAGLDAIQDAIGKSIERCPYSLQRHELIDFFDTDSNLSLGYTDVSPFVRGLVDDTDVYVLWRDWDGADKGVPPPFVFDIQRYELCPVPISRLTGNKSGFAICRQGWLWLGKERSWVSARTQGVLPGATLLLPVGAGGYDSNRGWTGKDEDKPASCYEPAEWPSDEDMLSCLKHGWRSIAVHTDEVRSTLCSIFKDLPLNDFLTDSEKRACLEAVDWHDIGKNHAAWQDAVVKALKAAEIEPPPKHLPLAKFSLSDSPQLRNKAGEELERTLYRLKSSFRPGVVHEVPAAIALRRFHIEKDGKSRSLEHKDIYLSQLLSEYLV